MKVREVYFSQKENRMTLLKVIWQYFFYRPKPKTGMQLEICPLGCRHEDGC
jgi:hypothetical protein